MVVVLPGVTEGGCATRSNRRGCTPPILTCIDSWRRSIRSDPAGYALTHEAAAVCMLMPVNKSINNRRVCCCCLRPGGLVRREKGGFAVSSVVGFSSVLWSIGLWVFNFGGFTTTTT